MKYDIEEYKGFNIQYDDYSDKFVCDIEIGDNVKNAKRSSLDDVRKEIDKFIKANLEFKPFKAICIKYGSLKVVEVTSIRTDGKFISNNGHISYEEFANFYREHDYDALSKLYEIRKEVTDLRYKEIQLEKEVIESLKPIDVSVYKID